MDEPRRDNPPAATGRETPRSRWNLPLGRILGIEVRVHVTFFALLALLAVIDLVRSGSPRGAGIGLAAILALFVCVLLHEFGHALAARRYGIPTRSITLLPIGGVARLERMPEEPKQELVIALAGPAVNAVIAASTFAVLVAGAYSGMIAADSFAANALWFLTFANVILGVFNLLPALPMDGGGCSGPCWPCGCTTRAPRSSPPASESFWPDCWPSRACSGTRCCS